jgi:hypothetical protein
MVEEWLKTVQNRKIGSVDYCKIRILLSWLMRHCKNSHNSTLFHTILHNTSHYAYTIPLQRGLYARLCYTKAQ